MLQEVYYSYLTNLLIHFNLIFTILLNFISFKLFVTTNLALPFGLILQFENIIVIKQLGLNHFSFATIMNQLGFKHFDSVSIIVKLNFKYFNSVYCCYKLGFRHFSSDYYCFKLIHL